ncbi:MAG: hypothetical protein OXI96_01415, partial [Acidimicrobiaceae bacterium]|nr:hypothetical protein [Acidimicrobiaceae bacterium]
PQNNHNHTNSKNIHDSFLIYDHLSGEWRPVSRAVYDILGGEWRPVSRAVYDILGGEWRWMSGFFAVFLVLLCLMVPVLTAASVLGERQRGTLMLVQLSLLRPSDIVWGKAFASVVPVHFPIGAWAFTTSLVFLEVPLTMTGGTLRMLAYMYFSGLTVWTIVLAVSIVSVLISTFVESNAVGGVPAIALNCGMGILLAGVVILCMVVIPDRSSMTTPPVELLVVGFLALVWLVLVWVTPVSFSWACKRLRLPARK